VTTESFFCASSGQDYGFLSLSAMSSLQLNIGGLARRTAWHESTLSEVDEKCFALV
jgi:hypothetical protein